MTTEVRLGQLTPEAHHGMLARVLSANGVQREGRLAYSQNPSYRRLSVRHWFLFTATDAISLQWEPPSTTVTLLDPAKESA